MRFLKSDMATDKVLCCIMALFLCLSQLAVGVFADTNYCTTCRHGCPEHGQQGTSVRVSAHAHCPEVQQSCCELNLCHIVQVEDIPVLVTAPETPSDFGILGILPANGAELRLPEEAGIWPQAEASARSAPLYLQHLSLRC
jgi:hypothetical protein